MKRSVLAICLALGLLMMAVPPVMASYQASTVDGYGPYQTGSGGEFTLSVNPDLAAVLGPYATTTKNQWTIGQNVTPNIQTFCVEEREYIYPNTTYDVTIGQTTQLSNHQLTNGAAWLYSQFATGVLTDYDYTTRTNNLVAGPGSNNALQEAIWYYMGEGPNNANNKFIKAADGYFQSQNGNPLGYSDGAFGVAIMNLWAPGSNHSLAANARQDQLVYVPEPFTLLFLGGCLLGAGMAGRKFNI